ncbi:hypothetical protein AMIS_18010 [Actinoplanes missouriensis 431]|uniref:Secreted protein n=1 Tax=Actinoplanes missouriensis (strain ATCC 14538 / DSM 43046 / CBS 188.64 / JCM 3121 / NBRC 102363 / NCIMB 12654 / NRRL B-3342 / UNCC 431) TaxID=512565 RepID=I0H1Y4_ACTM4|nr:hypothetical protein [Actinoplanes missouriensis]BAL87021.1 hypothetical protein AMIS_18010 [Actinoplanes missouriensis 431]
MTRNPGILTAILAAAVLGTGGCAGSGAEANAPAVCESFATVQNTVTQIRNANVSENGLAAVRPYVTELLEQLNQLVLDAQAQFKPQADQLRTTVDQLSASVDSARADPGATTFSAVRSAITAVGDSARALRQAISGSC